MFDDYLELPLCLEDYEDDEISFDLWVYMKDKDNSGVVVLRNVTSAVRYQGWWSIEHKMTEWISATAKIVASDVLRFDIIEKKPKDS